jgi:hypothetical protein
MSRTLNNSRVLEHPKIPTQAVEFEEFYDEL